MITSKDIELELNQAEKIIKDPGTDVNAKINVLWKLLTVSIKVLVNIRSNSALIMKKLGVELIKKDKK